LEPLALGRRRKLRKLRKNVYFAFVNAHPTEDRLVELSRLCHEAGYPLTSQRRAVFEALLSRHDHPTAEDVFEQVRASLPEIHRATVYRTLDRLVELGVAARAHRVGHAARFDPNVDRHDHAVCVRCGAMEDVEPVDARATPLPHAAALAARGFEVIAHSVQVQVLCPACRAQAGTSSRPRSPE
jgi:Fe2+ or Zn2+ uptake regulation protein